ncbi:MAG: class I SAM-dependent methyltransferase [Anaerolineae bacterium]|nr:class I SAM-dependent methyltransferase [Anaerolineae bacterium]
MSDSIPKYVGPKPTDRVLTRDEVKARFDQETAAAYSQQDPIYLPDYASALALVIEALCAALPDEPTILDLGAGTGNLARRVLGAIPNSYVTLIDFSLNMLSEAPDVLADFKGRYNTICEDFFAFDMPPATFDGIVSSFAIHHARGRAEYGRLYQRIRSWLKPGMVFACCDVVAGSNQQWTAMNEAGWQQHLRAAEFDDATIAHIFANYRVEDTPISLPEHLTLLREAGFAHVDVLWKKHNFAVYCAQK